MDCNTALLTPSILNIQLTNTLKTELSKIKFILWIYTYIYRLVFILSYYFVTMSLLLLLLLLLLLILLLL